jgi:hypothetical protein
VKTERLFWAIINAALVAALVVTFVVVLPPRPAITLPSPRSALGVGSHRGRSPVAPRWQGLTASQGVLLTNQAAAASTQERTSAAEPAAAIVAPAAADAGPPAATPAAFSADPTFTAAGTGGADEQPARPKTPS